MDDIFGTSSKKNVKMTKKKKQQLNKEKRQEKIETKLSHLIPPGRGNPYLKKRKKKEAAQKEKEEKIKENNKNNKNNNNSNNNSSNNSNQNKKKQKTEESKSTGFGDNEYLDLFNTTQKAMPAEMAQIFEPGLDDEKRSELFDYLDLTMAEKYAWAVPNEKALRIISNFSPVVEIGAGRGYWGKMLLSGGVDYVGYDIHATDQNEHSLWCDVKQGGVKLIKKHQHHTLFMCYPDDFEDDEESLSLRCLKAYKGEYIIYVGELFGNTILENPWGKSSSGDFQQELVASFHMLLEMELPSWQSSVDSISVWKRTQVTMIDDIPFKSIPTEERVPISRACPSLSHLLK